MLPLESVFMRNSRRKYRRRNILVIGNNPCIDMNLGFIYNHVNIIFYNLSRILFGILIVLLLFDVDLQP